MKRPLEFIAFLLTLPIMSLCQNKISIGVHVNSQINIMTIKESRAASGIVEKGGLGIGYSFGIQAQYPLTEKAFLRSGINYQNSKYLHKVEGLKFASDILNGTQSSIENEFTISSIGVPLDFGYSIKSKNGKVNFVVGFGGVINVNSKTNTKAMVLIGQKEEMELTQAENEVNGSTYTAGIFGGMEMGLSKLFILVIEPHLRLTPNHFTLFPYDSKASTFETGMALRIRMR